MAARVAHFEVHAANPQRAIEFYTKTFGWEFNQWGDQPYWLIKTGPADAPGIDGGLVPRRGADPVEGQAVNAYVCTVMVDSLDEILNAVTAHGGSIALPKMPVPTIGWLAYFKDTEGNIFGAMQNDPNAR
jgi:uncharacterized protein